MREKRRFIRFDTSLKTNYITRSGPRTEKTGITKDVCAGGIQLLTEEELKAGSKLALKIFTPDALNPTHLNGTVTWSREISSGKKLSYSAGIEFVDIEEDNKNTFLRFLCGLMYRKTVEKKGG